MNFLANLSPRAHNVLFWGGLAAAAAAILGFSHLLVLWAVLP